MALVALLLVAGEVPALAAQTPAAARAEAVTWLLEHQNPTGSWGADARRELLTTALVLRALREAGAEAPQLRRAQAWLAEAAAPSTGDQAALLRADHHAGTTWAVRGKTPIVSSTGARFGLNLISAVSPQGTFRFMTVEGRVNATVFVEFLKRLVHNAERPVYLIVDGHSAHKAKVVQAYVRSLKGRLRLFFLPPYSPELNPDECVWNDLKNNTLGRQVIQDPTTLRSQVLGFFRYLARTPQRVRGYFNNETTRYAAVV